MLCFVDTNLFVYWLQHPNSSDPHWAEKHRLSRDLIHRLASSKQIVISGQVLNEFINVVTRKGSHPLNLKEAAVALELLARFPVVFPDLDLIRIGIRRAENHRISYYDSLIVEAALRAGCTVLYTEDLHHGMRFDSLEVRNPFKS